MCICTVETEKHIVNEGQSKCNITNYQKDGCVKYRKWQGKKIESLRNRFWINTG